MDKTTFIGLPSATIDSLLTKYVTALEAISLGQEYAFSSGGMTRRLTRADLQMVKETIAELQYAKETAARGGRITHTNVQITGL